MLEFKAWRDLFGIFLVFAALTPGSTAAGQTPRGVYATAPVEGLAAEGDRLFWKSGCGGDYSTTASFIHTLDILASDSWRTGPPPPGTLYRFDTCERDRVASRSLAVDAGHVYWIAADGRLMRASRSAPASVPETLHRASRGTGQGYHLIVANGWAVWSDGTGLYRLRTERSAAAPSPVREIQTIVEPGPWTDIGEVVAVGEGYVMRAGGRLHRLIPLPTVPPRFVSVPVVATAGAFTAGGDTLYFAAPGRGGGYSIVSIQGSGASRTIYSAPAATPEETVNQMTVQGGTLFWHVERIGGGPVMRMPASGGDAERISTDFTTEPHARMVAASGFLFWPTVEGLHRLSQTGPAIQRARGDLEVTGVEWVQVVQTPDNLVPMIGGKRTAVRVFARSRQDGAVPWSYVWAQLQLEGSTKVYRAGPVAVSPGGSDRKRLEGSFLFLLDPAETAPGSRRFTVALSARGYGDESDLANNRRTFVVRFAPRIDLAIQSFAWRTFNSGLCAARSPTFPPAADGTVTSWEEIQRDAASAVSVLPISSLSVYPLPASGRGFDERDCEAYLRAHNFLKDEMDRAFPEGGALGVSFGPPAPGNAAGWCCPATRRGNQTLRINNPGNRTLSLPHELIHRYYSGFHPGDAGFAFPRTSSISSAPVGDIVGIDLFGSTPMLMVGEASDGSPLLHDLMSYAGPAWISLFTYCRALRGLSEGRTLCPASVEGGGP